MTFADVILFRELAKGAKAGGRTAPVNNLSSSEKNILLLRQEKTLKPVLEILPVDLDASKCILVCEISDEGFLYAIKDDTINKFIAVAVFQFDKSSKAVDATILQIEIQQQSLLSGDFKKVYIVYSVGESVLMPFSLYNADETDNLLNLIHGDIQSNVSVITDVIDTKEIYNSYRVTTDILNIFKSKFPGAVTRHQYSVLLKQVRKEKDILVIIFYQKTLVLMLIKNGCVHFINNFSYNTTEDVLYILLNTCAQFEVADIPIEIGGMIEINSHLAREIDKYFSGVGFAKLPSGPDFSEEITSRPSHYFSHIFEIDSCE